MARGWYDFHIGDRIEYNTPGSVIEGVIIDLYVHDKSKGRIKMDNGKERDVVLEWCKKINK